MKKTLFFSLMLFCVVLFFISCRTVKTDDYGLIFMITNWNTGPAVEGATVKVYEHGTDNLISTAHTDEMGLVIIPIEQLSEKIDVKVTKPGHARSLVEGLKASTVFNHPFEIILMTALLNPNPELELDPVVLLEFNDLAAGSEERTLLDITQPISGSFRVDVSVDAQNHVKTIYEPLLGRIGGSSFVTTDISYVYDSATATFEISPTGHMGEVGLFTTVYDHNQNRTLRIDYLNIQAADPGTVTMYQPVTMVDFSDFIFAGGHNIENIWSITRRRAYEFRSDSRELLENLPSSEPVSSRFDFVEIERDFNTISRIAPPQANLWTQLYWTDWHSADYWHSQYPEEFPDPGDEPDGYNIYRSIEGFGFTKFAFIPESSVALRADDIVYFIAYLYNPNLVLNAMPFFLDASALLHPEQPMHYRITSVYGTHESTPTYLGSVTPLDSFNVELLNPANEAVNVSLTPEFSWRPTKALHSDEGTVTYHYRLFIYDWVQSDNGLITPFDDDNRFIDFSSETTETVSALFTGENTNPVLNCVWKWYNPYTTTITSYNASKLEPYKSYNWAINLAYGVVDQTDSRAYSIAADFRFRDYGWYIDPAGCLEPDFHPDFITGNQ